MDGSPLMHGMIDSHFHTLEMEKKGLDPANELARCFKNRMAAAVDIGISLEGFQRRLEITKPFPAVYHTLGMSPGESEKPDCLENLALLNDLIDDGNIVAIGEIGLDYYWNYATPERQKEFFGAQLEIASDHDLPVVIHNREADRDIYDMLKEARLSAGGIIHCFSSTKEMALRFVDLGYLISFAGNITYKKAENLREAAAAVPIASLIAETDAPYLAPVPYRGKPNTPDFVGYVYRLLAELKGLDLDELIFQLQENAVRTLRLNLPE